MKGPLVEFSLLPSEHKQLKEQESMNSKLKTEIALNVGSFISGPIRKLIVDFGADSTSASHIWEPILLSEVVISNDRHGQIKDTIVT